MLELHAQAEPQLNVLKKCCCRACKGEKSVLLDDVASRHGAVNPFLTLARRRQAPSGALAPGFRDCSKQGRITQREPSEPLGCMMVAAMIAQNLGREIKNCFC